MRKSIWSTSKDIASENGESGKVPRRLPVRIPTNLMTLSKSTSKGFATHGGTVRREPVRMGKTPQGRRFVPRNIINEIGPKSGSKIQSAVAMKFAHQDSSVQQTQGSVQTSANTVPTRQSTLHSRSADTVAVVSAAALAEVAAFPPFAPLLLLPRIEAPRTPILLTGKKPSAETIRVADAFIARSKQALEMNTPETSEKTPLVKESYSNCDDAIATCSTDSDPNVQTVANSAFGMLRVKSTKDLKGRTLEIDRMVMLPAIKSTIESTKSSPMLDSMRKSLAKVDSSSRSIRETYKVSSSAKYSSKYAVTTLPFLQAAKQISDAYDSDTLRSPSTKLTSIKCGPKLNIFTSKSLVNDSTSAAWTENPTNTTEQRTVENESHRAEHRGTEQSLQAPSPTLIKINSLVAEMRAESEKQDRRLAQLELLTAQFAQKCDLPRTFRGTACPLASVLAEPFDLATNSNSYCVSRLQKELVEPEMLANNREILLPHRFDSDLSCLEQSRELATGDLACVVEPEGPVQETEILPIARRSSRLEDRLHKLGDQTPLWLVGRVKKSSETVQTPINELKKFQPTNSMMPLYERSSRAKSEAPKYSGRKSQAKTSSPVATRRSIRAKSEAPKHSGRKSLAKTPTPVACGRPSRAKSEVLGNSGGASRAPVPTPVASRRTSQAKYEEPRHSGRSSQAKTPTPVASKRGIPGHSQSPTPLGSGRRHRRSQPPTTLGSGRRHGRSQSPTPVESGRKHGRSQSPTTVGSGRKHGRSQSPTPLGSGRSHGRSQPPKTLGSGRRHGRSQSPTPVESGRKHGRSQSPTPLGCGRKHGRSQSPTTLGSGRRHGRSQSPTPLGSGRKHGRSQSPTPVGSRRRHGRSQSPTPLGSGCRYGRSQPPTPVGSGRRHGRSQSPTPLGSGKRPRRSQSPTPVGSGKKPRRSQATERALSKWPIQTKIAITFDLNSTEITTIGLDTSPAKQLRATTEGPQLKVSYSTTSSLPLKHKKVFDGDSDSPLALPLDVTAVDEKTCNASRFTSADESPLKNINVSDKSLSIEEEYNAKLEGYRAEAKVTAKKDLAHPPLVVCTTLRSYPSKKNCYGYANTEHSYSRPPWAAGSLVADYHSFTESPGQDPGKGDTCSEAFKGKRFISPNIITQVHSESPKKIETPNLVRMASPEKIATPTRVPVESPKKIETPVRVESLKKIETPIRVESPKKIEAPIRIQVETPKNIEAPARVESPKKIEIPIRIRVVTPKKIEAPFQVKSPKKIETPFQIQVETPKKVGAPTRIQLKTPKKIELSNQDQLESSKRVETPAQVHLETLKKVETGRQVSLASPEKTETSNPSILESPCSTGSSQLGLENWTNISPKQLNDHMQNSFVALERISTLSLASANQDFSQTFHQWMSPNVNNKRPHREEVDLLMNSPLYKCLTRQASATSTPHQKTTSKLIKTTSPNSMGKRRVWRPSDLIKSKSTERTLKSVSKNPIKSKYVSPKKTPKSLLPPPIASARKSKDIHGTASRSGPRKSMIEYQKLRKSFPKLIMTPVSTPVLRSRVNARVLDSAAKTSRNVQAMLELLQDE